MEEKDIELLQKVDMAKGYAEKWHKGIIHRRNLYHLKHYEHMGKQVEGETRYTDPTYTNTVDLAVGILQSNDFRWHVYGWTPSDQETKDSSSIEKYLAGTLYVNSLREEEDIRLEITQSFVRDGVACLYTVWDPEEATANLVEMEELDPEMDSGSKKTKVYSETPVTVKVVDPLSILAIPGGKGRWSVVIQKLDSNIWELEQNYGIKMDLYSAFAETEKRNTAATLYDYWEIKKSKSKEKFEVYNAHIVDDTVVKSPELMTGYNALPFTIGFFTNDMASDPEHWVKGLVDILEPSVAMLEIGVNRRQKLIDTYSGLPIIVKTRPGRRIDLDKTLNVVKAETDDDISIPEWHGSAPDVDKQLDFIRNRVQQSGFSESMYGSATGNTGSGYAISQESDQNRIRLTQPVVNLQLFWTTWARKVLYLTEKFAKKSKIRIYGRVKERDFMDLVPGKDCSKYLVECRIRPDFPTEKTRKHAMATQVKGIISDETLMSEYLDIEQPDEEKKRKMIEAAHNSPVAQQYAMILALQDLAKDGDEAAAMALEIVKKELPKPGEEAGTNPTQPTGLQSSTGQPTPQAGGMPPPGQSASDRMSAMASASPNMQGGINGT